MSSPSPPSNLLNIDITPWSYRARRGWSIIYGFVIAVTLFAAAGASEFYSGTDDFKAFYSRKLTGSVATWRYGAEPVRGFVLDVALAIMFVTLFATVIFNWAVKSWCRALDYRNRLALPGSAIGPTIQLGMQRQTLDRMLADV